MGRRSRPPLIMNPLARDHKSQSGSPPSPQFWGNKIEKRKEALMSPAAMGVGRSGALTDFPLFLAVSWMAEAVGGVVVHNANSLHVGVDDGWAYEGEAAFD